jgi:hypothetical protein
MITTTYTHRLSGRRFTATGTGRFGAASVDGIWDTGETGTIWPAETFAGVPVWSTL